MSSVVSGKTQRGIHQHCCRIVVVTSVVVLFVFVASVVARHVVHERPPNAPNGVLPVLYLSLGSLAAMDMATVTITVVVLTMTMLLLIVVMVVVMVVMIATTYRVVMKGKVECILQQ